MIDKSSVKIVIYSLVLSSTIMYTAASNAFVYMWKDAAGVTNYGSTPPYGVDANGVDAKLKFRIVKSVTTGSTGSAPTTGNAPTLPISNPTTNNTESKTSGSTVNAAPTTNKPAATNASSLPPAPDHYYMPKIDINKIPVGSSGVGLLNLTQTNQIAPVGDGQGEFRVACDYGHMKFDDPIVFPGQQGASHLHTFFGNASADYRSTADSILNSGNGTCHGGIANRSGYWVPTMIDTATNTPIAPIQIVVYYKSGGLVPKQYITAPPKGLRMITGDMRNTKPWNNPSLIPPVFYSCITSTTPNPNPSTWPAKPCLDIKTADGKTIPGWINMDVNMPQCWDGVNLDSADHKSHMAYPSAANKTANYCPATHPIAIPKIDMQIRYQPPPNGDVSKWRLSSDMYPDTSPGGYSGHGDWFNGWKPEIIDLIVKKCLNAGVNCGTDFLPDGRTMN